MKLKSSDITPEEVYLSRRRFIKQAGVVGAGLFLAACDRQDPSSSGHQPPPKPGKTEANKDELGNRLTSYAAISSYNNFYEFTTSKEDVAVMAADFKTSPWSVEVGGLVRKKRLFDLNELISKFGEEERIYRMRCVEGWSMVIPWLGFSLRSLLKEVEPLSKAKYVKFTSIYDPDQLPGQKGGGYTWPYVEGLRLDEAVHELTLLATGLYGKPLLPQSGAPIRLVVPWKYGFKSIKSIVRIDLVEEMPTSLWMRAAPDQYGFFANINPEVPHPRWTQSTERRIGEVRRRRTLPFNGYEEAVGIYKGMDLERFF